jgi:hypothetical protein
MQGLILQLVFKILIANHTTIIKFLEKEAKKTDNSLDDYAVRTLKKYLNEKRK